MTQTKTCVTCQHWEKQDGSNYPLRGPADSMGVCNAVAQYWDSTGWTDDGERAVLPKYANCRAFVRDASDYYAMLVTRNDFGCVQHKQK